jgi:hypothetical protein
MYTYHRPGTGWDQGPIRTRDQTREYVRWLAEQGGDGLKLGAEQPEIMAALAVRSSRSDNTPAFLRLSGLPLNC